MSILKNLAFTAVIKGRKSPWIARREQLVARLTDQQALFIDPSYVRTVRRWQRQEDGQKVQVDRMVRVQPWWRTDEKGQTVMTVKHGLRPMEFEKGKAGIVVGPKQTVADVIEALIAATKAGELDSLLEQAKASRPIVKKKAA